MIKLDHIYLLAGAFFLAVAVLTISDKSHRRRWRNAAFWGLLGVSFLFGSHLSDLANGVLVLGLVGLGALGLGEGRAATTTTRAERRISADGRGNLLFLPALMIPGLALAGTLLAKSSAWGAHLIDPSQATLISLILGALIAGLVTLVWMKPPLAAPLEEGRRLLDAVGWSVVLPQMLAALGAVFLASGVGDQVGLALARYLPLNDATTAVAAYCIGMALFTVIMGNAFAAFPVMTAAVGLPVLVQRFQGDAAAVLAIGMLAGFSGTLMTPMAANFNVVPANLLDLPDRRSAFNGVIRAQTPTAALLLVVNILLMRILAFPS